MYDSKGSCKFSSFCTALKICSRKPFPAEINGNGIIIEIDFETRRVSSLTLNDFLLEILSMSELVFKYSLQLSVSNDAALLFVTKTGDFERDRDSAMASSASCIACSVSIALQI